MNPLSEIVFSIGINLIIVSLYVYLWLRAPVSFWVSIGSHISPNQITILRGETFFLGIWFCWRYQENWLLFFCGLTIIVLSLCGDGVDGKVARACDKAKVEQTKPNGWKEELGYRGVTTMGKWLDPLIDKLNTIPIILMFADKGYLNGTLTTVLISLEIVSTLMRPPLRFFPQSLIVQDAATGLGKVKFGAVIGLTLVCLPFYRGWITEFAIVQNIALGVVIVFAALSVLSRFNFGSKWTRAMVRITKPFLRT